MQRFHPGDRHGRRKRSDWRDHWRYQFYSHSDLHRFR
nr:MAG TPA: hypothetical protein [Caudoviricetes sp.]